VETYRVIGVVCAALILAGCRDVNVETDSFATMLEARQRGAVERGWVPAFLPDVMYELRAAYDTRGTRRWGIANFSPDEAGAVRAVLAPDEVALSGVSIDIPPRVEWWPIALRNQLDPETIKATGLRAHRSQDGVYLFAVNWNQGRAYYWTRAGSSDRPGP
jgi:hypothetical protein